MRVGGHIGYAVRLQFRRRGFATAILRQSLAVARAMGIERPLVTCDDSNFGSISTIERCGGVLDRSEEALVQHKLRYWIPTALVWGKPTVDTHPKFLAERQNTRGIQFAVPK